MGIKINNMLKQKTSLKQELKFSLYNILSKYDLEGDTGFIAETIKNIPKKVKETYQGNLDVTTSHRFSIRIDSSYNYGESNDEYIIDCYRWETDEELKKRLATNKKRSEAAKIRAEKLKEAKIKREKTLYENLKLKFEKNK